jgi:hypothetical protein
MWSSRSEQLAGGRVLAVHVDAGPAPVSFAEALQLWQHDATFRSFFIRLLADSPFSAFRWEMPPITAASTGRPFELVLVDSPGLAPTPDPHAFAQHFRAAPKEGVVSFPNLGGDAILVVPCPLGQPDAYGHLAAFVRKAPDAQKHALWKCVGKVMEQHLGEAPLWLSTAGAGVSWLHVRLDQTPKYYAYQPYRRPVQ